nr:MAG TPA: hypothetical protein [Caudoviricetes sp.]
MRCALQKSAPQFLSGLIVQGIERGFPKPWGRAGQNIRAKLYTTFSPDYIEQL